MTEQTLDLDPTQAVAVAYIHDGNEVTYSFHHCTVQLLDHDLANHTRVWSGGWVPIRCGTDSLAYARNLAIKEYLSESKADWLFWVDTDMGFPPDVVDRLFEAADPADRPVMGALTFANRELDNDGMGGRRALASPVIMHWTHDGAEAGFDIRWDYPVDSVVRCDGIGSACVLVHRSVFEKVRAQYGENWYTRARNPSTGEYISEDLSFCVRLMALGIPVHVHTGVKTTHAKRIWLAEEDYWSQRALNASPPRPEGERAVPLPARTWSVPRYAVIPTRNRPAHLLSLVVSLSTQVDHIVVLDNASSPPVDGEKLLAAVPERVSVHVVPETQQPPNLARFWNLLLDGVAVMAKAAGEDVWDVALFNDDSAVPVGWYDTVASAMREHPTAVACFTDTFGRQPEQTLLTELDNDPNTRLVPWAFVVRGESGLRADESMRWWYFDTDFDLRARLAGGVLSVPGPVVANGLAHSSTVGPLAAQAMKDKATFEAKWPGL